MDLGIGPWRPDQPTTVPGVSPYVANVSLLPDAEVGVAYGPLKALSALSTSTALAAAPKGSLTAVTKAGIYTLFELASSAIYKISASGVPSSIGTGYNLPSGDKWTSTQFGTKAIFSNKTDGQVEYDIELGGAVAAISGAPKARVLRRVFDVLFALDCDGDNRLMRNSDYNYSNWTTGVANYQPMPEGTELVGIEEISDGIAIVFTRNTVYVLSRRADAQLYNMNVLARNVGAVAPWSIVPANGAVYFIDTNGFKVADASGVRRIGAGKVDTTVIGAMTQADLSAIEGAFDPQNERIRWRYSEDVGGTYTTKVIDYYLRYDEFAPGDINLAQIMTAASPGYTMEELDAFGDMDSLTLSLDDRFWYGGLPQLAGLTSTYLLAFFSGANLAASMRTSVKEMPRSGLVNSIQPLTDTTSATVTLNVSDRLADAMTTKGPFSMQASGRVPTRARGKNIQVQADIAAGVDWSYFRGFDDINMATGGVR
jgi:hypothetical protein